MDFVTNKVETLKNEIEKIKDKPNYDLIKSMLNIIEDISAKQDLQTVKIDELEEEIEYLNTVIGDMQQVIIENFDLENSMEENEHEHNCHCEDCDEEHIDEFYTLQCPFCEELFFIENEELDQTVDCPFCNKPVKAIDNIVKH